ncbi:MAG: ATP-binding protein [bacterium]|nr:ATP-binding protein [bacterium]
MSETIKTGKWNPSRVLEALGRIGYEPAAAILDIVDNSVSAKSTEVHVELEMEKSAPPGGGRTRTVVAAVSVTDNGIGMDEEALDNAILLGSSNATYSDNTLSKYGMGLKSASASLGRCCTIVSRPANGPAMAAVLDHDQVADRGEYVYELREASNSELAVLDKVCSGGQGTLVRITKIVDNLPSPVEILEGLRKRAGVTYFYALTGATTGYPQMNLMINDEPVEAVDPLFVSEIADGEDGDLDERTWDGLSVRYIERRKPIQLTSDGAVAAHVTITQLPHPPTLAHYSNQPVQQCREKYLIAAGNYGFYIYRNGRLIGWAESLGMVSRDVSLYSFRGRLEITADADDVLNLDVTKSRIQLSEIANTQLRPLVGEARKKSRAAWTHAGNELKRHTDSSSRSRMNEQLDRVAELEEKEDRLDESVEPQQEQQRRRKRREQTTNNRRATDEEGERVRAHAERVQYVDTLENNQLWERAHHPDHGLIVRVNSSHRMFREILEPQFDNSQLVQAFDLMFFSLARGEYDLVYKSEEEESKVEALVDEYRERVGSQLSEIVRQLEMDQLFNNQG